MPSAAKQRGRTNRFLKWRAKKKDFMLYYARGNDERAWKELRELMLLTNRQLHEIEEDKRTIDVRDEYREQQL